MNYFKFTELPKSVTPLHNEEKARNQMWASLIPGYQEADRNKKKKLKQEYRMSNACADFMPAAVKAGYIGYTASCITFDDCESQPSPSPLLCNPSKKAAPRKGNENMYVEQNMTVTEKTAEDTRRSHFLTQIDKIYSKKDTELREKFGFGRTTCPRTPKELVEWIKGGEWTYVKSYNPEEDDEWCHYESPIHGFRWTKIKEDRKGYEAATKLLIEEKTRFVNEIWAEVEPANFIKILEKFEKSKLH